MKSNYWNNTQYDLHYYTAGNPENSCVIFFHGFLGSGLDWEEVIQQLSDDFYCLAVDLPGHGKTRVHGSISTYSMKSFAKFFCSFIKGIRIAKASLVGYSMGGRLALYLTVFAKDLWSAAVFESSSPGLQEKKHRVERRKNDIAIAKRLENEELIYFLADWYQQPLFNTLRNNNHFQSIIKKRLMNSPIEMAKALRKMGVGVQPSLWNACKYINIPILLLAGEFDRKFCKIMSDMKSKNKDFNLKIIDDAGHNIHLDQPRLYFQEIHKFLTSTGRVVDEKN